MSDLYISLHVAGPNCGGEKEMPLALLLPVQSHQIVLQEGLREMVSIVMMQGTMTML